MKYKCTTASREKWLSVAADCPYATYFHTPYWYELIAPKQDYKTIEVNFEDGAFAIIPIAKIKRAYGLLVDHFSSPGGTYGGWISTSPLNHKHVNVLTGLLTNAKNLTYRVNPFYNLPLPVPPKPSSSKYDFTHIIDLTRGEREIFKGFCKGHKSAVKNAVRNGITVKPAECPEEWDKYYALYRSSIDRWRLSGSGTIPGKIYPHTLFHRLFKNRTDNEVLWLAVKDGTPIAGALYFYWGRHAVYWHGAASSDHFRFKPNNLLHWEIIKDAIKRGYDILDFNPSGGYAGVVTFKDRFGTTRVPSPIIQTKTPMRQLITNLYKLAKNKKLC